MVLDKTEGPIHGRRKASPHHRREYPIGKQGFGLHATLRPKHSKISIALYIDHSNSEKYFNHLKKEKNVIEQQLGELEWKHQNETGKCRIETCLNNADPYNRDDWTRQHEWLANHLNTMHKTFSPYISEEMDDDDWLPDDS